MHHANILVGGDHRNFVFEILADQLDFKIIANPDFLLLEDQTFGIGQVRDFERWVIGKPLVGEVKVSLIIVKSITFEAQNALLKVLEEPPLGTYIFINLQSLGGLLPTFLSRVRVLEVSKSPFDSCPKKGELDTPAKKFLNSKIKEKFSMIRSLSKKENKEEMRDLIKNLEEVAYEDKLEYKNLRNILTAKIFASTRGSSPKMLLEWLSCVL